MNGGTLRDDGSNFYNNAGIDGGVIYCDACTLEMTGTTFTNNQAVRGGSIFSTGLSVIELEGITVADGSATRFAGFLYMEATGGEAATLDIRDDATPT